MRTEGLGCGRNFWAQIGATGTSHPLTLSSLSASAALSGKRYTRTLCSTLLLLLVKSSCRASTLPCAPCPQPYICEEGFACPSQGTHVDSSSSPLNKESHSRFSILHFLLKVKSNRTRQERLPHTIKDRTRKCFPKQDSRSGTGRQHGFGSSRPDDEDISKSCEQSNTEKVISLILCGVSDEPDSDIGSRIRACFLLDFC